MKLPKELTTVTKLSKYLAVVVFIAFPIIGFFLGMRYQEMIDLAKRQEMEANLSIPRVPTPTPNPTVNWQTYRNEKYGFLVKYPGDWLPDVWEYDDERLGLLNPVIQKELSDLDNMDLIHVPADIFIAAMTKEQALFIIDHNKYDQEYEKVEITIGGKPATKYAINDPDGHTEEIYLNVDKSVIYFSLRNKYNKELFYQILSTFKFLDQEQVACTQDVKLCPDGKTYVSRQGPNCEFAPCPK